MLFKTLATLRTDAQLFTDVDELEWRGATPEFSDWAKRIEDSRLLPRVDAITAKRAS